MSDKTKKPPLRWRKHVSNIGIRSRVSHHLHRGDTVLARAQPTQGGWYWYGLGQNTASTPKPLEECKAEARAAVLAWEREQTNGGR